ncbi:hypothetical protein [Empedobacter tilapiae]|uniref:hypothetical protein n=1 Tax=Empedobacter tilapiae TaxID=2491114 RepID=UPI0028D7FD53|nr:hypothetical protein [Empedobacter tilapiae]
MKKIILLLFISFNLQSCTKNHTADIAAFTYLPYFTMDVLCQGYDFGPGAGGISINVNLKPGEYPVYWHDAKDGKKYQSINKIKIPENIEYQYVVLHVYANHFVEVQFTNNWPEATEKGKIYRKQNPHNLKINNEY